MVKNLPLVSVIIPIYNVEPFLRRCLDSILNQIYTNVEIILVDDGSPDNCPQICDEYAAKDCRIVVIHKKNGGLSDARNAGLDVCRGEYVTFVDSDDWVDEKYVDILLDNLVKENADVCICENVKTDGNLCLSNRNIYTKSYSSAEALRHLFKGKHTAFAISCGKIYKKSLFNHVRFPVGKFHEDEFTTYILFYKAKKIIYTSEILYYYYQRSGSIVSSRHPWDVLEFLESRYLFFKEKKENALLPYLLPPLCWQLLCASWYEWLHDDEKKTQHYQRILNNYILDLNQIKVALKHSIPLKIFNRFPIIYYAYRNISPIKLRKEF